MCIETNDERINDNIWKQMTANGVFIYTGIK